MENVRIGLAGWGDHDTLYPAGIPANKKLSVYARHYPLVEVDSSFYGIPSASTVQSWVEDTPDHFGFVVKAHQSMTGHERGPQQGAGGKEKLTEYPSLGVYRAFREAFEPMRSAGKLKAILFQFPPWFDFTHEHIAVLRKTRERIGDDVPLALEFRHRSWYAPDFRSLTLAFMEREGWIHSVCDEPQAGVASVPIVPVPTHPERTIVRFHGRNIAGWNASGESNWRTVRYLYDYQEQELLEWMVRLEYMLHDTGEICVIFNNNSGGHGVGNAKSLMALLGYTSDNPPPEQLLLF